MFIHQFSIIYFNDKNEYFFEKIVRCLALDDFPPLSSAISYSTWNKKHDAVIIVLQKFTLQYYIGRFPVPVTNTLLDDLVASAKSIQILFPTQISFPA